MRSVVFLYNPNQAKIVPNLENGHTVAQLSKFCIFCSKLNQKVPKSRQQILHLGNSKQKFVLAVHKTDVDETAHFSSLILSSF